MPSSPWTLAISWGSATTLVVPRGRTSPAKRAGLTMLDSIWIWASMRPGSRYAPCASMVLTASVRAKPRILPPPTLTSVSRISPVSTSTSLAFRISRSAGLRPPAALSTRSFRSSISYMRAPVGRWFLRMSPVGRNVGERRLRRAGLCPAPAGGNDSPRTPSETETPYFLRRATDSSEP